jgi:SAM-dependent methyltransferase
MSDNSTPAPVQDSMKIGSGSAPQAESQFRRELEALKRPSVLELGTLRWEVNSPTHHASWAPHASMYVKSDVQEGMDVDVAADAHDLAPIGTATVDAYIAVSVYEHLRRPWVAASAARRVMKPGGILLVVTHQTFPIHGYPSDYFRFSDRALAGIFEDAGFEVVDAGYQYPCSITPPREVTRWNPVAESYLNVAVFARAI